MMKSLARNLSIREGRLYYRVSIPQDVRVVFVRREIWASLKTQDPLQAKSQAAHLNILFADAIREARCNHHYDGPSKPPSEATERFYNELDRLAIQREKSAARDSKEKEVTSARKDIVPIIKRPFSEVWPDYLATCHADRPKTKDYKKSTYVLFEQLMGDMPISKIRRDQTRLFVTKLKNGEAGPVSFATINTRISAMHVLFNWLIDVVDGDFSNPFNRLHLKEERSSVYKRVSFTPQELAVFFSSPLYTGSQGEEWKARMQKGDILVKDSLFWVPLIAYYSGMRLNEICQLYLDDVRVLNGIWYFDLNEKEDKQLKTVSSARKVPIHQHLIDLGFIYHCQDRIQEGNKRVFEDIKPGPYGKYGFYFTKRFARLLKALGLKHSGLCFHSFRHTFIDNLKEAGVERAVAMAICGHDKGSSAHDVYGHGYSIKVMKEAIDRIQNVPILTGQ